MKSLPPELRKNITYGNGSENVLQGSKDAMLEVEQLINNRPRMSLGVLIPSELFSASA